MVIAFLLLVLLGRFVLSDFGIGFYPVSSQPDRVADVMLERAAAWLATGGCST
jgi:hypothetical protein